MTAYKDMVLSYFFNLKLNESTNVYQDNTCFHPVQGTVKADNFEMIDDIFLGGRVKENP